MMLRKVMGSVALILCGLAILTPEEGLSETPAYLPGPGAIIPAFSLPVPVKETDRAYLKLGGKGEWQPGSIRVDVLLLEIMSFHCYACGRQAPYVNTLYDKIEKDPKLKDKVKIIGIGAGHHQGDVSREQERYKFPLFPDENYKVYDLVGAPFAPFFIFARPYGHGGLFVIDSHLGVIADADELLTMVRNAKVEDISTRGGKEPKWVAESPVIPISEDELMKKVGQSLSIRGEKPRSIRKVPLPGFGTVYLATLGSTGKGVFACVVARRVPCEDCHSVFFVYSFDDKGLFLDFVPIQLTKAYNRKWDIDDVEKIKGYFVGKSIDKLVPFNSEVDAVTSATISSGIVFNSMNKTGLLYEELARLGYVTR